MKKIALILDTKVDSGGALGMCLTKINYIKKLSGVNLVVITTYKSTSDLLKKEYKINNFFYNKNSIINRFINFFFRLKISSISSLETCLKKLKIDKIFFITPSYLNILIKKIDYNYTVFDLSHLDKRLINLSEHDIKTRRIRDLSYEEASKYAKFIIIGTSENKDFFKKYYKCSPEKLKVIKFVPYICTLKDINNKISSSDQLFKNFLLYPAQYWEHKNHKFLINFFNKFGTIDKLKNITLVCTGYDKGQLKYLKELVNSKNLNKKIKLLNYVSDDELKLLYKNSIGVVFPSLIGSHSFPLYEAFYFKKPIFYNEDILSKEFKELVYLIDIKSEQDLYNKISSFLDNKIKSQKIINNAEKKFYQIFNEEKIINQLKFVLIDN